MIMANLGDLLGQAFDKVQGMINVNNVVGTPITTPDGTVLIPVTKVTVGVGGGGGDHDSQKNSGVHFTGGAGAGISISPIAFISISGGNSRVIYVNQGKNNSAVDKLVDMVPEAIDKVTGFIDQRAAQKDK